MPQNDPTTYQYVFQRAMAARQAGADPAAVDELVRKHTGLANLPALATKVRGGQTQQEMAAEPEGPSGVGGLTKALAVGARGASMGFAGDILGALPGGEGIRAGYEHAVQSARRENPVSSRVGEFAAGLIPGLGLGGLAAKGATAAGRGLASAAGRAGAGSLTRAAARAGGTAAAGAATGGLEGALFGAGGARAEGGDVTDALQAAGSGAASGALLGGLFGATGGALGARRELKESIAGAGQRLRGQVREQVESIPGMQDILQRTGTLKNEAYSQALQGNVPTMAAGTVMQNPVMVDALQASGRQGRQFARQWRQHMERVQAGLPSEAPTMPAVVFDDMRKELGVIADKFKSARLGSSPRGAGDQRLAQEALDQIDGFLDDIPGFREAQDLARLQGTQSRALDAGKKAWSAPADEVAQELGALKTPAEQTAYRAGLARNMLQKLGGTQENVKTQLTRMLEGDEGARKARLMLGSDEAFDEFMNTVRSAKRDLQIEEVGAAISKFLTFTFLGSSVLAGAFETGDALLGGN